MISKVLRRPVLVSMIIIGCSMLGVVSYNRLPVELIPYTELPMLIVNVISTREADPGYVEQNGIVPLEGAIAGLEDIERIESYVDRRRAMIFVYYEQGSNQKYAYLKLQQKVATVQSQLGDEFIARVWKIDTEQLSNQFMTLQARGEGSLDQIREVVDNKVVPELDRVDGLANIEVYGGRRHSVEVMLDEAGLRSHDLTASQVSSIISQSSNRRQYLGKAYEGRKEYFINLVSDHTSLASLEEIVIKDTGPVLLKHVATVVDGGAEEESISRVNGMESISITLIRDQQVNLLSLSRDTREVIDEINQRVASDGIVLTIQEDAAEVIERNIDIIKQLAIIGSLLAVVILWVFLRNLPLVLMVAVSIPLSVTISLNLFYALDITINTLTLVGLAIAIGMLLDNSVVILENIHRQISRGKNLFESVVTGTKEVSRAVVASTLTTICVFLPFVFSENFLVQTLGRHIGISIISTLLVSLGVAFLLIPTFTYRFLTRQEQLSTDAFTRISQRNRLMQIYTLLLKSCLRFPARTVIVSLVVLFISVVICLALSVSVPEEVELNNFNLYATMSSGTTLTSADQQVREMDTRLEEIGEIEERTAMIQEDDVILAFRLKDDFEDIEGRNIASIKEDIIEKLSNAHPRVDFSYQQPASDIRYRNRSGGGPGGVGRAFGRLLGIEAGGDRVIIRGIDLDMLRMIADDIQYNIDRQDAVRSSELSLSTQQPGIDLMFDKDALSHFGVAPSSVVAELSSFQSEFTSGAVMKQGTEEVDIVLKNETLEERSSDDLRELQIPSASGSTVPLTQLARLIYRDGEANTFRVNQEKQIEITYRFEQDIQDSKELLTTARATIDEIIAGMRVPAGVSIEVEYDETDLSEFYFLIFATVILIYMVLSSVFESLATPLIMMFTFPMATVGALWGLILTGNSILNANALVGFMILLGVVVNNGIILIDYTRLLREKKYRPSRALIAAGQARVRPILITAITTILAMLPLAMGKVEYVARIGAPFAITVIGGLTLGTLFTLVLVPTVSFGLENTLTWWRRLTWKVKLFQIVAVAIGMVLIYQNIDAMLWRIANATALVLAVPAFTYFTMTSLRRTRLSIIGKDEPIRISIQNVVKVYDDYSRFMREWHKPERQKQPTPGTGVHSRKQEIINAVWQLPLYAFLYYFTYLYLEGNFWRLVFSVVFYIYTIGMIRSVLPTGDKKNRGTRLTRLVHGLIFWCIPIANLAWLYTESMSLALVIIVGLTWYPAAAVYHSSQKLYREGIDINRLTGRFRRSRKMFYRLVKLIPIIGKKKVPFRALNQVSLEIGSGMFGLIGPNGAGKTTLMRIICGVLQQSRGKATINDFDLVEKREELQSLIGYLPQEFGTYENMTAYQFLDYQALLKGLWDPEERRRTVEKAIASVHLDENRDVKIKSFSGGMKQRVGIAQTLLHLPRILVVDEPTAGLDPRERIRFRNLLSELARDRIVIFSTHIIEDVSSSCNRLAVLTNGMVRFLGTPREMVEQAEGAVWQVRVSEDEFETMRTTMRIVHHMHDDNKLRLRILSRSQPHPDAITVTPTLEDAYLLLLGSEETADDRH